MSIGERKGSYRVPRPRGLLLAGYTPEVIDENATHPLRTCMCPKIVPARKFA